MKDKNINIKYKKENGICKETMLDSFAVEIGSRIRTYRKLANMSQKDLGNILNVTSQQIHKYENGSNEISFKKLCLIAMSLNIPIEYLIDEVIYLLGNQNTITEKYCQNKKNVKYLVEISKYLNNIDNVMKQKVVDFVKMMV